MILIGLSVKWISFIIFIFSQNLYAVEPWAEKTSEAIYRQLELERQLQQLLDKYIEKELQIKIGHVSIVVDVFLKQKIVYRTTFP